MSWWRGGGKGGRKDKEERIERAAEKGWEKKRGAG
jgi:hypothetical protein